MERIDAYAAWLKAHGGDHRGLSFAVDCSDGMASLLAHDLFPDAAVFLNDVPDGRFPHHSPNPLKAESREQLASCVRNRALDCGVIFDGDADRCMFVDETGAFIQPDLLIPALAETFLPQDAGAAVIHDVRTSRGAIERLRELGFSPRMVPVGHAFAKVKLREYGAVCGGELAGHYYFRDFHGCDSGELAALRILAVFATAKRRGQTVSDYMQPVVSRYANSGELNFRVDDKEATMARMLEVSRDFGEIQSVETMDGYRVEYADGWVSVRKSNTEPYLRLLAEFREQDRLNAAVSAFTEVADSCA